jgi:Protein of unknown function (DUF3800)
VETDLVAYIDESKKPVRDGSTGKVSHTHEYYVVAAAIVLSGEAEEVRAELLSAVDRLGYRLHYREFRSVQRRTEALDAITAIDGWEAYIFETAKPMSNRHNSEHHLRSKTLGAAFNVLSTEVGVHDVVLESRAHVARGFTSLDRNDNSVLKSLLDDGVVPPGLSIRHTDKSESLFQLSDMVAGARTDQCLRQLWPLCG